jgi:hypothetical protein
MLDALYRGGFISMKAIARHFGLVVFVGIVFLSTAATNVAAETIKRTVRGTVTATNLTVNPQTIIIQVTQPNKEELIVGARVPTGARITRGKKTIRLAELKVGEKAEVTYLKSPDGLIAQSIHVR